MLVVAAVIERNGRVLICQRGRGSSHALKWEFPGGKVEIEETPSDALSRELREELGIEAQIGDELHRQDVSYPNGPLLTLLFFAVTEFRGEPRNLQFEQMVWADPRYLADYDFLEGDLEFIRRLAEIRSR